MSQPRDRFLFAVEDAEPNGSVPAINRLRRALKTLLRRDGLRSLGVIDVPPEMKEPLLALNRLQRRVAELEARESLTVPGTGIEQEAFLP